MGVKWKKKGKPQAVSGTEIFHRTTFMMRKCRLSTDILHPSLARGVVDHSSLNSFQTINHFPTSCGIFLPSQARSQVPYGIY